MFNGIVFVLVLVAATLLESGAPVGPTMMLLVVSALLNLGLSIVEFLRES